MIISQGNEASVHKTHREFHAQSRVHVVPSPSTNGPWTDDGDMFNREGHSSASSIETRSDGAKEPAHCKHKQSGTRLCFICRSDSTQDAHGKL